MREMEGGSVLSDLKVTGASGSASWQSSQAGGASRAGEEKDSSPNLYEMMRDAKEKAEAARDKFKGGNKANSSYGDAPIEAHARLARAKNSTEVNLAAGYARRQIARLKSAKRTDPDNAKRIQAAINQLQKAVTRAGKKKRELNREKIAAARQEKLEQEKKSREARRERQELRRKQAMRMLRESSYIREAEADDRMQSHMAAVEMKLREQVQGLASSIQPSAEAVAQQYAAGSVTEVSVEVSVSVEIDVQA